MITRYFLFLFILFITSISVFAVPSVSWHNVTVSDGSVFSSGGVNIYPMCIDDNVSRSKSGSLVGYTFNHGTRVGGQTGNNFNGSQWVTVGSTSYNFPSEYSIVTKVNLTSDVTNLKFIASKRGTDDNNASLLFYTQSGNLQCKFGNGTTSQSRGISISLGSHWVGMLLNSTSLTCCVDSICNTNNRTVSGVASFTGTFYIMNSPYSNSATNGTNDIFMIYSRGLSISEYNNIVANQSSISIVGDGLVGQYLLGDSRFSNSSMVFDVNNLVSCSSCSSGFAERFGGSDYVNITSNLNITESFSFSTWFYALSSGGALAGRFLDNGKTLILLQSSNKIRMVSDGVNFTDSTSTISYNSWNHFVVTRNSSNYINMFLNGVNILSSQLNGSIVSGSTNIMLGNRVALDRGFNGSLGDVRVFNRSLSSSEVSDLYSGVFVNWSGLVFSSNFSNVNFSSNLTFDNSYLFNDDYFSKRLYLSSSDTDPNSLVLDSGSGLFSYFPSIENTYYYKAECFNSSWNSGNSSVRSFVFDVYDTSVSIVKPLDFSPDIPVLDLGVDNRFGFLSYYFEPSFVVELPFNCDGENFVFKCKNGYLLGFSYLFLIIVFSWLFWFIFLKKR